MTGLSKRIMDAWIEANPVPKMLADDLHWGERHALLHAMLRLEAYESAVMQFLVPPEMWCQKWDISYVPDAAQNDFAEALFSAIFPEPPLREETCQAADAKKGE